MKKFFLFFILFNSTIFSSQIELINLPLAKSLSLAKENAVVDNKGFSILTNPAMLYKVDYGYSLGYNKLFYYANTSYDLISFSFKQKQSSEINNSFGIVFGRFSSGDIKVKNIEGLETGKVVEYKSSLISFGFSTMISYAQDYNVSLGLSGFGIFEEINVDCQYWGGNIGFVYNQNFASKLFKSLSFGVVVKGLGVNSNLLYDESLCLEVACAKFILGYENFFPKRVKDKYKFGLSLDVYKYKDYKINLDVGCGFGEYNNSITGGLDLSIKNILLIYSFCQHEYLGDLHNIMLGFKL